MRTITLSTSLTRQKNLAWPLARNTTRLAYFTAENAGSIGPVHLILHAPNAFMASSVDHCPQSPVTASAQWTERSIQIFDAAWVNLPAWEGVLDRCLILRSSD